MVDKDNLSEKIEVVGFGTQVEFKDKDGNIKMFSATKGEEGIKVKDAREKIQNAQGRLHISLCAKIEGEILLPKKDIKEIYEEIDKIFKEEFGDKLIK